MIISTAWANMSGTTLGSISANISWKFDAPIQREDSTKGLSFNDSTWDLTTRAVVGQLTRLTTRIMFHILGPRTAARTIINGSSGSIMKKSTIRIKTSSSIFP